MTVTLSSKYQLVVPEEVRKVFSVHPGEKFAVIPYEGHLEFIPVKKIEQMRGFLKGAKIIFKREKKDRPL